MDQFLIDEWLVSPERNTIELGSRVEKLEPRVMDLLVFLARHPDQVLSRDQLLENVWPHTFVSDSALQTAISALRKAFGDDPRKPKVVQTIPKRGYRLLARSTAANPLIAVLPFEDLNRDPDQSYLVEGITDLLISALGQNPRLRVLSRHSAIALHHSQEQLTDLAMKLGVTYLVEGTVANHTDDGLLISVRLIATKDDTYVWSNSFSVDLIEAFALQQKLADEISQQVLGPSASPSTRLQEDEVSAEAMDAYLRGRYHYYKFDPDQFPRAIACFESAIASDPGFAAAHAAIADVWGAYGYWGVRSAAEIRTPFQQALLAGRQSSPGNAEVTMLDGAFHFHCLFSWQRSRELLEEAIAMNPNLAHAHLLLGLVLGTLRDDSALAAVDTARRLDPLAPPIMLARALCLAGEEQFSIVEAEIGRMLDVNPSFAPARELGTDLRWLNGDPEALEWERLLWQGDPELSRLFDQQQHGTRVLNLAADALLRRRLKSYVSPRVLARMLCLSNRLDEANDVLADAVADRDLMQIDYVQMAPSFLSLRRTGRYHQLADSIRLPAA